MTPKPVALACAFLLVDLSQRMNYQMKTKLLAPKPVALQPASLLPVCAFLLVDVSQRMNYQMTKKMDEDDSCQQVSRS